ncbi:GNAT family N-acetyltransferase [Bradyrhizobium elkanii]|jgi:hypothetical protein|uniref:GNAT family N-acetyltransferase n=2 Tax=Bradyrhizobium elkanii TaxID=29448 RepID=UPI00209F4A43|nr:GNAT family N-acetyltransferase [Bradyrhizobium elkanii]MCP1975662.1 hypothetical protein [Bradyrhizobium elkanii]MCS3482426.1 hypothetical protein [Bradyrhizobium elkanii]MCS3525194.1 hypothetical protein [Bradyrhizobium elkanii]MCS4075903.1 hypothetical protein [Bradyrhizobium elkanii]MCS4085157.1 hypothetical protein [Bradyrhizobium elkanii]
MSSLIGTVKLRETATNAAVVAEVYDGVDQSHLANWQTKWKPIIEATRLRLEQQGAKNALPQSSHWEWDKKAAHFQKLLAYRMFVVVCQGDTQGLMAVATDPRHRTRVADDKGRAGLGLAYVDYLESAPWNRPEHVPQPRFRGVGSVLIAAAVQLSLDENFKGRVGLHSLPQSEDFYRTNIGMADLGPDNTYANFPLRYFEMTEIAARAFIQGGKK